MDYWVRFVNGSHRGIPQRGVTRDGLGHWVRFVTGVVGRVGGFFGFLGIAGLLEGIAPRDGGEW